MATTSKKSLDWSPRRWVFDLVNRWSVLWPREATMRGPNIDFPILGSWTRSYGLGGDVRVNGYHEPAISDELQRRLTPVDVFWDIGASFGYYALLAAQRIPADHVWAFEPNPARFAFLRKNNHRYCAGRLNLSQAFVTSDGTAGTLSLNRLAQETPRPTAVKIDIDGNEQYLLQAASWLTPAPRVFLEAHFFGNYSQIRHNIVTAFGDTAFDAYVCFNHRSRAYRYSRIDRIADIPEARGKEMNEDYLLLLLPKGDVPPPL